MQIHAVPAFKDNYIWLLSNDTRNTIVVDPGDARPVQSFLTAQQLRLAAILVTHHHADHTGGVATLQQTYDKLPVYGPAAEQIDTLTIPLNSQDTRLAIDGFPDITVLETRGHTAGHISYLIDNRLFCGDTLFAGGCGRLLGGTATQLFTSLNLFKALPVQTEIYCAHEYTLNNLQFALHVEPENPVLHARLDKVQQQRAEALRTVPSTLQEELDTNPFLRCDQMTVRVAAERYAGQQLNTELDVFRTLRRWKDQF